MPRGQRVCSLVQVHSPREKVAARVRLEQMCRSGHWAFVGTKLERLDEDGATFVAVCLDHGAYETHVDPEDDQPYLDLATLYRNLVKERAMGRDTGTLQVMMKGGDWAFGCQLVDGALGALATPAAQMPMRIFTPQVLAPAGAKLSKSLLSTDPGDPHRAVCQLRRDVRP